MRALGSQWMEGSSHSSQENVASALLHTTERFCYLTNPFTFFSYDLAHVEHIKKSRTQNTRD